MPGNKREVWFASYCRKCKNWEKEGFEDPCSECLNQPFMVDSHKPLNFVEDPYKKEKKA